MIIHCIFVLISFPFLAKGGPDISRIVGGSETMIEKYPYQVSLQRNGTHFCGGSIISNSWILTAGHCATGRNPTLYTMRSGSTYCHIGGRLSAIKSFTAHEKYNNTSLDYDIAVIQLVTPLTFDVHTAPIPLATDNEMEIPMVNDLATVTGWGRVSEDGLASKRLQKVELPLIAWSECAKAYVRQPISERMFCAGVLHRGGKDACQGDSGGPLVHNGKLIGIVSWGFGCARPAYPGVFTKVVAFREWITRKTGV